MIKKLLSTCAAICMILSPVLSVSAAPLLPSDIATPESLVKGSGPAVYWYTGYERYVFPNEETFYSWFSPYDFARVRTISDASLVSLPIRGNVYFRPGSRIVKISTDPKVYGVDRNGTLRWLENEAVARTLYGQNWAQYVEEIPDAFFASYSTGATVTRASDFNPPMMYTPSDNLR